MLQLQDKFYKLIGTNKSIENVTNAILEINKIINRFQYEVIEFDKYSEKERVKIIDEIFDFTGLILDYFGNEGEFKDERFCLYSDSEPYEFTRGEMFVKFVEIWNNYPPFVNMFVDMQESLESENHMLDDAHMILETVNDVMDTLSKKQLDTIEKLKETLWNIKGHRRFIYVSEDVHLDFNIPKFVKKETADPLKKFLYAILINFYSGKNASLICEIEKKKEANEVFGIIYDNGDWQPIPESVLKSAYESITDESYDDIKYLQLKK